MPPKAIFDSEEFIKRWDPAKHVPSHENGFSFRDCIAIAFNLPKNDDYEYRAQGATTLELTQKAINGKRAHNLHAWYAHDDEGNSTEPQYPNTPEITAYTNLFTPSPNPQKALSAYKSSSKPNTLRSLTSSHLMSRFHYPTHSLALLPPHNGTRQHTNPYLDTWTYICQELEWAGPIPTTVHTKISHHTLPILYHHYGCLVPSYAALYAIAKLAQPRRPSKEPVRPILDIGSGNGYWTFLLRRLVKEMHERGEKSVGGWKELDVYGVDNQLSEYRLSWIRDTIVADGAEFLAKGKIGEKRDREVEGGKECVLLLVYPQATGGFTEGVLRAYKGDTIVVAGTQNRNGFTGFRDCLVDEWVEKEMSQFDLALRMPLPSFAGKDEALYVFKRRET